MLHCSLRALTHSSCSPITHEGRRGWVRDLSHLSYPCYLLLARGGCVAQKMVNCRDRVQPSAAPRPGSWVCGGTGNLESYAHHNPAPCALHLDCLFHCIHCHSCVYLCTPSSSKRRGCGIYPHLDPAASRQSQRHTRPSRRYPSLKTSILQLATCPINATNPCKAKNTKLQPPPLHIRTYPKKQTTPF